MTSVPAPRPSWESPRESGDESCLITGQSEIRQLLQRLVDARCMLVTHASGAEASMLTTLLQVGDSALWVDVPSTRVLLEQWLQSQKLHFEGSLERIAVRFACGPARLDAQGGRSALLLPLPDRMLHLQRREYLRCQPPGEPRCRLQTPCADGSATMLATHVRDVSGGGLSLLVPANARPLAIGEELPGCRLELPGLEPMEITLHIRHVVTVNHRGRALQQAGCEFVGLAPATQSRLLRYIMQIEREQASRRRGS